MNERLYTKEEVHEYANFCIGCDRDGLPLLDIEGYFNLNK